MEADDNDVDFDCEDDAAPDGRHSDAKSIVEDQENCDPFLSESSCSSDDTSHESDTDRV